MYSLVKRFTLQKYECKRGFSSPLFLHPCSFILDQLIFSKKFWDYCTCFFYNRLEEQFRVDGKCVCVYVLRVSVFMYVCVVCVCVYVCSLCACVSVIDSSV